MSNYITIKLRRGTAAQWTATNPVLAEGEVGLETDTRKFKVGTGAGAWNSLQYWGGSGGGAADFVDLGDVPASYTGQGGKYVKVKSDESGLEFGTLTIAAGDLPSGIDAAKIADGSVSNTEFQTLNGASATFTSAKDSKLSGIEDNADVTDATNVNAAGAVMESDYNTAHSVLVQQSGSGSPVAVHLGNNTILGKSGGGNIAALSASTVRSLINVEDGADVTDAANVGSVLNAATAKTTPVDADTLPLSDSAASGALKKLSWANLKATLKTYTDTLYAALVHTHAATDIVSGELDGDRLPAISSGKKGGVPATGTPSGKYLKDDGTWASLPGGSATWGAITGTLSSQTDLQTALDGKTDDAIVVNSNTTAANDQLYHVVASATFTDPSPTEGKGYVVLVRNGTATVGGTGYSTAGQLIRRVFHSGSWANYVYNAGSGAASWGSITGTLSSQTDLQTALDAKITAFADPNADRIVFWDDSAGAFAALTPSTGLNLSGTNLTVRTASATQTGIVELATDAETATGTATDRAVTPANIASLNLIGAATTVTLTNKTFDANGTGNSLSNVEVADFAASAIVTASETISANNNDTTIPTSAAVKAYADSVAGGSPTWGAITGTLSSQTDLQTALDAKVTGFADPNADRIVFWDDSASAYAALEVGSGLSISGTTLTATGGGGGGGSVLSPAQLTAWQNDYNPSGWGSGVSILRLSSNGFHFITGFAATADGHTFQVVNVGSFPIGLYNQNSDSTAGNRNAFDDHDVIILPGQSVTMWYDGTDTRFRLAAGYALNENSPFVSRYWNECISATGDNLGTAAGLWPTGGGGSYANDIVGASFNGGRTGVIRCSTGTGTTGRAGFYASANESQEYSDGTGRTYMEYRSVIYTPSDLSDATNNYNIFAGWLDSDTAEPPDGAWLRYNHANSSGNWERVTGNSGSRTTADTGIAVAASTWYVLRAVMYPNGTAELYINGVSGGRNTADLPGTGRDFSFGAIIRKTAGAAARVLAIDGIGFTNVKYTK